MIDYNNRFDRAVDIFREHGGMMRTSEAIREGIHPDTFYKLAEKGTTEKMSRGLYRLSDAPPLSQPDLAVIAKKIPKSVICLISALSYYELTSQIPHQVYIALPKGAQEPRIEYPPLSTFRFSERSYSEGISHIEMQGFTLHIYDKEKTIADCFKFRNQIGSETAVEALKLYSKTTSADIKSLMHYADICRVSNVIKPYVESIL